MPDLSHLCLKPLTEVAAMIQSKALTSVDLTQAMLKRIDEVNPALNAYASITVEQALSQARAADQEIANGNYRGVMHGIPIAIKDIIDIQGLPTGCGSTIRADQIAESDATVIQRLKQAGAVILGKLNMTEFALYGYHPDFEPPKNPWDPGLWSGVSSSGSGVATSASLCFAALGTDTGGSIRYPAAANGIVGIKPTWGKVSRHGVFPLAESLDHVGPMARTVADCAALLNVIAGPDPKDLTTIKQPTPDYSQALAQDVKGMKIGIDRNYVLMNTAPELSEAVMAAVDKFQQLGAEIVDVDTTGIMETNAHWLPVTAAEAFANHRETFPSRADEYGPVFRDLLEQGSKLSAADYADAQFARARVRGAIDNALSGVDVMICPPMPMPAPPAEAFPPQGIVPNDDMVPVVCFSAPFNFSGHPTLTQPCGFINDTIPLALQLVAPFNAEASLIRAGNAYEQATEWHQRRPPCNG
ncbi:MAG: amidase [Halopseudomonas sp.]